MLKFKKDYFRFTFRLSAKRKRAVGWLTCLFVYLFICLFVYLFICLFVYLFICLFVYVLAYLPVCFSFFCSFVCVCVSVFLAFSGFTYLSIDISALYSHTYGKLNPLHCHVHRSFFYDP